MRAIQRQTKILAAVKLKGACSIVELAQQLEVSDETIRRNIKALIAEGLVDKVHGGIVLAKGHLPEAPFQRRMNKQVDAKQLIADLVAEIIQDGDSIMMDTGSTTAFAARGLQHHQNLSIITNCTEIARSLSPNPTNKVHFCGGTFRADDWATFGTSAISYVKQFQADYAILSIGAVTGDAEFMDFHLEEAEFSRAVIQQARKTIIVVDHTKFGRNSFVKVCDTEKIDMIVTDLTPPQEFVEAFTSANVEVITPT